MGPQSRVFSWSVVQVYAIPGISIKSTVHEDPMAASAGLAL